MAVTRRCTLFWSSPCTCRLFPVKVVLHQIMFQCVIISVGASWKPWCSIVGVEMFTWCHGRWAEVDCRGGDRFGDVHPQKCYTNPWPEHLSKWAGWLLNLVSKQPRLWGSCFITREQVFHPVGWVRGTQCPSHQYLGQFWTMGRLIS